MADDSLKGPLLEPAGVQDTGINLVMQTLLGFVHTCESFFKCYGQSIAAAMGPIAAGMVLAFVRISSEGKHNQSATAMLAVLVWMIIWWVTEPLPIAITALLPLLLYPTLGIENSNKVAEFYMNDTISLFIGSFMLAMAVERYQVHRRLALKILLLLGGKQMDPRLLLLGFCVGPAFVSMWISNTATAIMMMPVSVGVLEKMKGFSDQTKVSEAGTSKTATKEKPPISFSDLSHKGNSTSTVALIIQDLDLPGNRMNFLPDNTKETLEALKIYGRGVILAVCYAVSIGGLTTLTGTGTNMVLSGMWSSRFHKAPPISYMKWFLFAFPLGAVLLIFLWILICLTYCPPSVLQIISHSFNRSVLQEEFDSLGPISFAESTVLQLFGVLIALWMTRDFSGTLPGWGKLFKDLAGDGTASILMALPLFIIPNGRVPGEKLMSWKHCKNLPWDIVLLLGGGFAIAKGFEKSGLSDWITVQLGFLQLAPYLLMVPIICVFVGVTTEFVSNNSTATIFLPLLASIALSAHIHPLFYMVPATIAASYAFMLPISTPPDAVAYATGYIRMVDMLSIGFCLKVFAIVVLSALMPTLGVSIYELDAPFLGH